MFFFLKNRKDYLPQRINVSHHVVSFKQTHFPCKQIRPKFRLHIESSRQIPLRENLGKHTFLNQKLITAFLAVCRRHRGLTVLAPTDGP